MCFKERNTSIDSMVIALVLLQLTTSQTLQGKSTLELGVVAKPSPSERLLGRLVVHGGVNGTG